MNVILIPVKTVVTALILLMLTSACVSLASKELSVKQVGVL